MYCSQCGAELLREAEGLPALCSKRRPVHRHQLRLGAGVLIEREAALLLLQRSADSPAFPECWNLPAGYCEPEEAPRITAARKAAEETGLQVDVGRLVDAYFFDDDPGGNGLLLVYEALITGGELQIDGSEAATSGFFAPEKLPSPLCGSGHDQAIEEWRRQVQTRWQPGAPLGYCPHCAHRLQEQVAFDRPRSVCPACGFIHFRAPKVGVSLLIEVEGRVLLIQRAVEPGKGKWCLPSGFVEWDEAPEVAATRECEEETGLVVAGLQLLEVGYYTDDFRGAGINLTYQAQVAEGSPRAGDDAAKVRFFASGELPSAEEIAFLSHRAVLERWGHR